MSIASRLTGLAGAAAFVIGSPSAAQFAPECSAEDERQLAIIEGAVADSEIGIPLQGVEVSMHWLPAGQTKAQQRKTETGRVNLTAPTGYAPVSGRIIDHASGAPVNAATIDLGFESLTSSTGEDGAFEFEKVPPGFYAVNVQHLGYGNVADSIAIDYGSRTTITVRLSPAAIEMDALEVVVRSQRLELRGFYDRKERGSGTFLTRQDVENMHAIRGSDILRRVAGVQLVRRGNFAGPIALGRGNCPFRYVIDGARLAALYSMDDMPPQWIEGIEIYKGPSQVPIEFNNFSTDSNGACGVIVIWTRNRR
jgi:hypothetical protein